MTPDQKMECILSAWSPEGTLVPEPTLATKVSIDLAFNISKLSKSAVLDNQTDWFLSQQLCIYFSGKPAWLKGSRAYTQPNVTPLEMLCKCQIPQT